MFSSELCNFLKNIYFVKRLQMLALKITRSMTNERLLKALMFYGLKVACGVPVAYLKE